MNKKCPCCSGKAYELCCKPFHEGSLPETALQLMRSRYSAYVLNLPDYIVATTHLANPHYSDNKFSWKRHIANLSLNSTYNSLEILDFKENDRFATVTFTINVTQDREDIIFTERSLFEKVNGRWLYLLGRTSDGRDLTLVIPGELKLLPIAYYGNPILRQKTKPIKEITPEIRNLVESMINTMDICDGVGIAAPQVNHSLALFVISTPVEKPGNPYYELGEIQVIINPKLSLPSEETWKASEGCLSIPGVREAVERPKEITIEYMNLEGETIKRRLKGWEAKVIMHENDHINGVLFIDRLDPKKKAALEGPLKKLEERIHRE